MRFSGLNVRNPGAFYEVFGQGRPRYPQAGGFLRKVHSATMRFPGKGSNPLQNRHWPPPYYEVFGERLGAVRRAFRSSRPTDGMGGDASCSTVSAIRALRPTLGRRTSSHAAASASPSFFHQVRRMPVTFLPCLVGRTDRLNGASAFTSDRAGFRTCLLNSPKVLYWPGWTPTDCETRRVNIR